MYKYKYLPTALSDLKNITQFIAITLKNQKFSRKVTSEIKSKVKNLVFSPESCPPYPFKSRNPQYPSPDIYVYRKLVVGDYIVLYIVDHPRKKIEIVRVFDGRSDYQNKI